ncbi:MAG: TonB-dependent receptor, partial [Bryobacteraceae bacterium]|nr:TonB-dependent receptor [Bryobacteraceae bacterium]
MSVRSRQLLLLLAGVVASFCSLSGQTTFGRLEGTVADSSGAAVPLANIVAIATETGSRYTATANERGEWVISSVPPATYRVSGSLTGFKTTSAADVKVDAGVPATVNLVLEVGSITETIEVSGTAEVLQTATATVSSTIQGRQIRDLPFASRNALELLVTQPGTQTPGTPRTSSINGLPKGSLNITIDGINVQDNLLRSDDGFFTSIQPRQDAVEEVTVITAAAGAESLGEGAAQIRFVTKSGTNTVRGGVFWQHRNSALNSNYYFNNVDGLPRDRLVFNQFGGNIGGPIRKNKAFFFFNKEEFRLPQTYNSAALTILNDDARNGVFRYRDTAGSTRTVNLYELVRVKNPSLPGNVREYATTPDPIVKDSLDLISRLATPASGVVRSRIPTNNDYNRNNFNFQTPASNDRHFTTAKLDYNVTSKHRLDFVWNYQSFRSIPDGVNGIVPIFPGTGTVLGSDVNAGVRQIKFSGTVSLRSMLSSSVTSEFRTGLSSGNSLFREEITPDSFSQWRGYAIFSSTTYMSNPYTGRTQSRRNSPVYQVNENLTWARGSHLLNFGFNFTQINLWQENIGLQVTPTVSLGIATNDPINTGATGIFDTVNFPNSTVAQRNEAGALYALLTGRVAAINRSVSLGEEDKQYSPVSALDRNRQRQFGFFIQDGWRVRPNFSLNFGLRWDIQLPFQNLGGVYTSTGDGGAWGVSGTGNLFAPGVLQGRTPAYDLVQPGQGAYRTYWKQFQPSAGFAWTVPDLPGALSWFSGKGGKAVVRGGYSISNVREGMNVFVNIFGSNQGRTLSLNLTPENFPQIFGSPGSILFRDQTLPTR